jgi:hypothetical protein
VRMLQCHRILQSPRCKRSAQSIASAHEAAPHLYSPKHYPLLVHLSSHLISPLLTHHASILSSPVP